MTLYQQFVDAFHGYGPTQVEIYFVLLFLLGFIIFVFARSLWMQKTLEGRRKQGRWRRFIIACREKGCFPEEIDFLAQKARLIGMEPDTSLVESNVVFDRFAGRVMASAAQQETVQLDSDLTALRHKFGFRPPPRGLTLNSTRELGVGQILYLVFTAHDFLEGRVDRVDERFLTVRLSAGQPRGRIAAGQEVNVYFNRPSDARYSGVCRVFRSSSDEGGQRIILQHCETLDRDQRRRDFRVEENRSICLWVIDPYLEEADDPLKMLGERVPERATLEDISGGGASIIFHRGLPANQGIYVNLDPGGIYGLPTVRGTIIRVHRRRRIDRWALSVRFDDLRPSERQWIVRHVFQREREQL